jgi:hypothetical protein
VNYREPGDLEVHVCNWDVVYLAGYRVFHKPDDATGKPPLEGGTLSSEIVDPHADVRCGLRFCVASGKTYVLHGPRLEHHDLAAHSVRDPDSWHNVDQP